MSEFLWAFWQTDSATAALDLTPYVEGWDLSDNSQELTSASMTNVGSSGFYSFDVSSLDLSLPLVFKADGGSSISGFQRYRAGAIGNFRALKRNVALSNLTFQMTLSADHVSPAIGKTVTAKIKKDNGAFATCTNAVSEISSGWYSIDLKKSERDADVSLLTFTATDCDMRGIILLSE